MMDNDPPKPVHWLNACHASGTRCMIRLASIACVIDVPPGGDLRARTVVLLDGGGQISLRDSIALVHEALGSPIMVLVRDAHDAGCDNDGDDEDDGPVGIIIPN